jgi:hypothetical protein
MLAGQPGVGRERARKGTLGKGTQLVRLEKGRDACHNLAKTPTIAFETVLSRADLRPR